VPELEIAAPLRKGEKRKLVINPYKEPHTLVLKAFSLLSLRQEEAGFEHGWSEWKRAAENRKRKTTKICAGYNNFCQ